MLGTECGPFGRQASTPSLWAFPPTALVCSCLSSVHFPAWSLKADAPMVLNASLVLPQLLMWLQRLPLCWLLNWYCQSVSPSSVWSVCYPRLIMITPSVFISGLNSTSWAVLETQTLLRDVNLTVQVSNLNGFALSLGYIQCASSHSSSSLWIVGLTDLKLPYMILSCLSQCLRWHSWCRMAWQHIQHKAPRTTTAVHLLAAGEQGTSRRFAICFR